MPRFVPIFAPSVNVPVTPTINVTWNNADKDSRITLSGNFLTATMGANADSSYSSVRADQVVLDKRYWEITVDALIANYGGAGIATSSHTLRGLTAGTGWIGENAQSVGVYRAGDVWFNNTQVFTGASWVVGDRLMFAYDGVTGRFWAGVNGVWYNGGNPAAGTGFIATLTNAFAALSLSGPATAFTLSPAVFTYPMPTGFGAYNDATGAPGGGGGGGGGTTGDPLLWNPAVRVPLNSNFNVYNVPASTAGNTTIHVVSLAAGEHAIIKLPASQPRHGRLDIRGTSGSNNRIWIIGGQIKRYKTVPQQGRVLTIQGIDHAYIEGVWINGNHYIGSGIVNVGSGGRNMRQWAQNCLITGINYGESNNGDDPALDGHGDIMIAQSALRGGVNFYRCSGWFYSTGFIFDNVSSYPADSISATYPEGFKFIDCDWNMYNAAYNPKKFLYSGLNVWIPSPSAAFFLGCVNFPLQFNNCYLWHDQPGTVTLTDSTGSRSISRDNLATIANFPSTCRVSTGDAFLGTVTRGLSQTTGVCRGGRPPAPNSRGFVDAGELQYGLVQTGPTHAGCFTGLNYPQPNIPGFITGSGGHPGYQE